MTPVNKNEVQSPEFIHGVKPQDSVSLRRGLLVAPSLGHGYATA